jgi:radical SAM superfamily enzyme YgiQ (UPF0313 family)
VSASFVIGLPFETWETIEETAQVIQEIKLDVAGINIAAMYPGTELYEMIRDEVGGLRWADPSFDMSWNIYDRRKAHIAVNELMPSDLEKAQAYLKKVGIESAPQRKYGSFRKSLAYIRYYSIHDRGKLFAHIQDGLRAIIKR